jgi:hypothetical protein
MLHSHTELVTCCGGASCREVLGLDLRPLRSWINLFQAGLTDMAESALDSAFRRRLPEELKDLTLVLIGSPKVRTVDLHLRPQLMTSPRRKGGNSHSHLELKTDNHGHR